jgi:hypothetical protein
MLVARRAGSADVFETMTRHSWLTLSTNWLRESDNNNNNNNSDDNTSDANANSKQSRLAVLRAEMQSSVDIVCAALYDAQHADLFTLQHFDRCAGLMAVNSTKCGVWSPAQTYLQSEPIQSIIDDLNDGLHIIYIIFIFTNIILSVHFKKSHISSIYIYRFSNGN